MTLDSLLDVQYAIGGMPDVLVTKVLRLVLTFGIYRIYSRVRQQFLAEF